MALKTHTFIILKPCFLVMFKGCGARELTELDGFSVGIKKSRNESPLDSLEINCKCET